MSIRAYYDVWCDAIRDDGNECGNWAEGATAMEYEGRAVARKRAKAYGWTYKRGVGDICPECARKLAEEGAE